MIRFTIPGQPVGKGRPRMGRQGGFSRLYTPEKTVSYESLVGYSAAQAMAGQPLVEAAVFVTLDIRVQIPASWSKKKQDLARFGGCWPATKPDIDNVEKAIFDGLNGVVWKDDVQVVKVTKQKRYSDQPGVDVHVVLAQMPEGWPVAVQSPLLEPACG
jgi:Holliday junction resolvase RusA-like endonuclease